MPLGAVAGERHGRAVAALENVGLGERAGHLPSELSGGRDTGLTLILVTHDSSVARRAQRIGIMQNGNLSIRQDTRGAAT